MNKLILYISALLLLSACAQMQILRRDPGAENAANAREVRIDSFFWGITARQAPSETEICGPAGSQRLEMKMSVTDVILTAVTIGIYVPHRAKYTCVNQSASNNGN